MNIDTQFDREESHRWLDPSLRRTWIAIAAIVVLFSTLVAVNCRHTLSIWDTRRRINGAGGHTMAGDVNSIQFIGPHISDLNLKKVGYLEATSWLELHSTAVTDDGLASIAKWGELRELFLNANPLTDRSLDNSQLSETRVA